jgi:hypothetical protein
MNKEDIKKICDEYKLNYSSQFIDFAMKFNDKKLVKEFCRFWRQRPIGGGDLNKFFLQHYKGKLGE